MRRTFIAAVLSTCVVAPLSAGATTFMQVQEPCALCDQSTTVSAVASYGSYVYDWDSKYDLIYFPFDGPAYFWYCPHCGYVQIGEDFIKLPPDRKQHMKEFLATVFHPGEKIDFPGKMERTRKIAQLAGKDDDYFAWLNRVLIYNYREIDPERAKQLAAEEIALLEKDRGELPAERKTRYYLLGEYYRMMGQKEKAAEFLHKSIKTHLGAFYLVQTLLAVFISAASLVIAALVLIKRPFTKKLRRALGISAILFAILFGALGIRDFIQYRSEDPANKYYTDIARDRLDLLNKPELPSTAPPQGSP